MQWGMAWEGVVVICMLSVIFFFKYFRCPGLVYDIPAWNLLAVASCVQMVSSPQHGFRRVLMTLEVLLWYKEILAGSAHHSCVGLCSVSMSCGGGRCAAQQCSSHRQKPPLSTEVTLPVPDNHWK